MSEAIVEVVDVVVSLDLTVETEVETVELVNAAPEEVVIGPSVVAF